MPRARASIGALAALLLLAALPGWAEERASDASIRQALWLLRRNPGDARAHYRLGDGYVARARETGDVADFDRAERALRRAVALAPDHAPAVRHLAYVLYSRHAFAEAAVEAARAIALDPSDGAAHGILGDAALEVGKYDEAAHAYRRMMELGQDLHAYARRAGLSWIRGEVGAAIADLERAIAEGRQAGRPRESIAWTQWQLGSDHYAAGRLIESEAQFEAALQTLPGYHRAFAGLAQVRAAQGRYDAAVELYTKALAVVPLPEYAAALGDVHARQGRAADTRRQHDLVEYIGRLSALNQALYNRELALFLTDHDMKLDEALALARKELEVRRDIYAWDVLAWALLKNGRPGEAKAAITEALRLGTRDARLFFHAGMIHARLGDLPQARDYLARALATNPYFHLGQAEVAARTLREIETGQHVAHRAGDDLRVAP
ncbi:MAG TPA: tetratricopeptide repeat protein [Candidatus Limnocylindrales bacterium]|nr:tetratricopeptide repeat protein [Candidatus Limnocylindrales bacterium]